MNENKKPSIRFKEFTATWRQYKLGEIGTVSMCRRIFKNQTSENGDIPFYKIGTFGGEPDAFISTKLFEEYKAKYPYPKKGDILISASGSIGRTVEFTGKDEYFQDSNIVWLNHNECLDDSFLKYFYSIVKWSDIEGSTIKRLYNDNILNTTINLPTIEEQKKIGEYFNNFDHLITLYQQKLKKLENIKKSILEKMFPLDKKNIPEIRFSGFSEVWEQNKLEDMCSIITKQTGFDYSATIKPALVTIKEDNTYPFIQNKDFEGMNINLDTDFYIPIKIAEKYPKITLDQPSLLISISGKIGNVGLYSLDSKAFIGGAVGICKLKNIEEGKTALYELLSPLGQKYFASLIKASSHSNITVEDIRNIEVLIPKNKEEKKKINKYLESINHLIILHQKKLEKLKNIKKSMLEKMFV